MTTELPAAVERAVDGHADFERGDDGQLHHAPTRFTATVAATPGEGERDAEFAVRVAVPTLSAAVEGEVAPVVEDGWYDTLALRLEDAFDVTTTNTDQELTVERDGETVTATFEYVAWSAREGLDDAGVLADFVEGTYLQGIVPGYDYLDPVAGLVQQATENAGSEEGGSRGGTPL